jgi:hypothetical protein
VHLSCRFMESPRLVQAEPALNMLKSAGEIYMQVRLHSDTDRTSRCPNGIVSTPRNLDANSDLS